MQNATDQARCVVARLCGSPVPYASLPWFWSDQGTHKLQIAGLSDGTTQSVIRGSIGEGAFSVFRYRTGRLVAIESVNRPADHIVGRRILTAGQTIPPNDVGDQDRDLKKLAA